jgi:hypothetical protein
LPTGIVVSENGGVVLAGAPHMSGLVAPFAVAAGRATAVVGWQNAKRGRADAVLVFREAVQQAKRVAKSHLPSVRDPLSGFMPWL